MLDTTRHDAIRKPPAKERARKAATDLTPDFRFCSERLRRYGAAGSDCRHLRLESIPLEQRLATLEQIVDLTAALVRATHDPG